MNSAEKRCVDLGFVDECDAWKLESRFFPSKVGGRPAWLDLSDLPMPADLECNKCRLPCIFLCQVYAPIDVREDCFHRTVFIFVCCNPDCCVLNDNSNFKVFRCQLGRKNKFYPFDPPPDVENWHLDGKVEKWTLSCFVCGCRGSSLCGKCKKVSYCGRHHQIIHWKESHKQLCGKDDTDSKERKLSCLLPEYELITEPEENVTDEISGNKSDIDSESDEEDGDEDEERRMNEFKELQREGKAGTLAGLESVDADLIGMAACQEDKVFKAFKTCLSQNPGQVLRYDRGGVPLWISSHCIPSYDDIKSCSYCGSKRVFEFQILPQLLSHLSLDAVERSVDWGVLAVFTCEKSCSEGPMYKTEFLWKQDVTV